MNLLTVNLFTVDLFTIDLFTVNLFTVELFTYLYCIIFCDFVLSLSCSLTSAKGHRLFTPLSNLYIEIIVT